MNLEIRDEEGNRPEDLLEGDITHEAKAIKNILKMLIEKKEQIKNTPIDYQSELPQGIVFKGGGPKGLAYLEALRALKEKEALKEVEKTAGTSAGAITATIFALDPTLKEINALEDLDLMQFLDPIPGKEPLLQGMLAAKDKKGVLNTILTGGLETINNASWNPFNLYNTFNQLIDLQTTFLFY